MVIVIIKREDARYAAGNFREFFSLALSSFKCFIAKKSDIK
jgi:hypothetical protein